MYLSVALFYWPFGGVVSTIIIVQQCVVLCSRISAYFLPVEHFEFWVLQAGGRNLIWITNIKERCNIWIAWLHMWQECIGMWCDVSKVENKNMVTLWLIITDQWIPAVNSKTIDKYRGFVLNLLITIIILQLGYIWISFLYIVFYPCNI